MEALLLIIYLAGGFFFAGFIGTRVRKDYWKGNGVFGLFWICVLSAVWPAIVFVSAGIGLAKQVRSK